MLLVLSSSSRQVLVLEEGTSRETRWDSSQLVLVEFLAFSYIYNQAMSISILNSARVQNIGLFWDVATSFFIWKVSSRRDEFHFNYEMVKCTVTPLFSQHSILFWPATCTIFTSPPPIQKAISVHTFMDWTFYYKLHRHDLSSFWKPFLLRCAHIYLFFLLSLFIISCRTSSSIPLQLP